MKKSHSGIALIIVVFAMLVFAILGAVIASMQANYFETARQHLRSNQVKFVSDSGLERGKELLNDNPNWRPPSPPGYLREYLTIGGALGHYDIYVQELGGGVVKILVTAAMDTE